MYNEHSFDSWRDLEAFAQRLSLDTARPAIGYSSDLLFRGQGSADWKIESTLQRFAPNLARLEEYYRTVAIAQTHIESLLPRSWPTVDYPATVKYLSNYDNLSLHPLPHYPYLVYLRHHGFPAPLLDWSRSLYVAAFFAYQHSRCDRVAIFAYREYSGVGKAGSSNTPQIHTLGRNIRTHPRHFLQQAEYTIALHFRENTWHLASHADVVNTSNQNQDSLWKLTAPSSARSEVLRQLEDYNINAYSLFQTEEALLSTLANQLLSEQ